MAAEQGDQELRRYGQALWKRRWWIALAAIISAGIAGGYSQSLNRIYEARCDLEYDPNPPRPLGESIDDVADPIGSYWSAREYFATQNQVLESRQVAERAVRLLGLNERPDFPDSVEESAQRLRGMVRVEPETDTRIVHVYARTYDAELARMVANGLAEAYIEKLRLQRVEATRGAMAWLEEQLESVNQDLVAAEQALHKFQEEHNVLSIAPEDQANHIVASIESYRQALTVARQNKDAVAARLERIKSAETDDPASIDLSAFEEATQAQALRAKIIEERTELMALTPRYGENHPKVVALQKKLTELEGALRSELQRLRKAANAEYREASSLEAKLRSRLDTTLDENIAITRFVPDYAKLVRERDRQRANFQKLRDRRSEMDLTSMLTVTHVRILDRALTPLAPIGPNTLYHTAAGALAGALLIALLVILIELLDRRVRNVEDVEELGHQVLGIVPSFVYEEVSNAEVPPALNKPEFHVYTSPLSAVAECTKTIRTNLMFMSLEHPLRSLVLTSANPREGKTTIACSLAITLAASGKRVLLVDTDLRKPRIHRVFDTEGPLGITSVMLGAATLPEAIQETPIDNLQVLPCGPVPPNPSELLHGRAFSEIIEKLQTEFDLVIFDSPPVNAVTDAAVIGPQVDGVLLVVRADETSRDALREANRHLVGVNAKVVGTVINSVDLRNRSGGYYYYYRKDDYYRNEDENDSVQAAE